MQLGSELGWLNGYIDGARYSNSTDRFRNFVFDQSPALSWKREDFDWDRDSKRVGMSESFYSASNPDLRKDLRRLAGRYSCFKVGEMRLYTR
jgi:hypothetical protein